MGHPIRSQSSAWLVCCLLGALLGGACDKKKPAPAEPATRAAAPGKVRARTLASKSVHFIGRQRCGACHTEELKKWTGSHHDLALALPSNESIRADLKLRPSKKGGEPAAQIEAAGASFVAITEGETGKTERFPITHVVGTEPLQQYLVTLSEGRLQPLRLSFDTRKKEEGGQRWFYQYPEESIPPGDLLHWTGPNQNWSGMCADCHSTGVSRGYSAATKSFDTQWFEIDVSCEACHGPGSDHEKWAQGFQTSDAGAARPHAADDPLGFAFPLRGSSVNSWMPDPSRGIARQAATGARPNEMGACGYCHSRRETLLEGAAPTPDLLQRVSPELAVTPNYHADGQVKEEVYVWGSFTQSKMFAAGVTCSDCHDPHSSQLKAEGNTLCASCHEPQKYEAQAHHFHEGAIPQVQCVDCHMPSKTFMGVDLRHDHSLRVPRPDLSLTGDAPNACTSCHDKESKQWASEQYQKLWGTPAPGIVDWLVRGTAGDPRVGKNLLTFAMDDAGPVMQRAAALSVATRMPLPPASLSSVMRKLSRAKESLLRLAVAREAGGMAPQERWDLLVPLLDDEVRAVRFEALRVLVIEPQAALPALIRVAREVEEAQAPFVDRASVRVGLGGVARGLGEADQAEAHLREALRLDPYFAAASVNLADFLRETGRDEEGRQILLDYVQRAPDAAGALFALALTQVRLKNSQEAILLLRRAVELEPEQSRYALTLAVALYSEGRQKAAVDELRKGLDHNPYARQLYSALTEYLARAGQAQQASRVVAAWLEHFPEDPQALQAAGSVQP